MTEATQEEADALLRRWDKWCDAFGADRSLGPDTRAYLARRPEPVDPDLLIAREAVAQWKDADTSPPAGRTYSEDLALRAIKLSREKQS